MGNAILTSLAKAVSPTASRLFAQEAAIDRRIYKVDFNRSTVLIFCKTFYRAAQLYQTRGTQIAKVLYDWNYKKAEIRANGSNAIPISASATGHIYFNQMTQHKPEHTWIGGRIVLSPVLYRALGTMIDSDKPMGLVEAATNLQLWVNPKCVELFKLPSIEEAVPRDTSKDWLPQDLERKRILVRDSGETPFEITYTTRICDGTWKLLTNQYQLVDNRYLIGSNLAEEIITIPDFMPA